MKNYLSAHLLIAGNAVVLAVIICAAAWYVSYSQKKVVDLLTENAISQVTLIGELAELTDRNGADAVTEKIITDCPRRAEFEDQLSAINTATKKELLSIQQLVESCGAFDSERKALMVSRLEREYAGLEQTLALLATLRDLTPKENGYTSWKTLIDLEVNRSALLTEQVVIQEEIITLLLSGTDTRTRIGELVRQAQDINQSLLVTNTQIDELRLSLMK